MAIDFSCSCGRHFHVSDDKAGSKGKCPNCGHIIQVPAASITAAPRAAPAMRAPGMAAVPQRTAPAPTAPAVANQPSAYPAPGVAAPAYSAAAQEPPAYAASQEAAESSEVQVAADNDTIPGFSDAYAATQAAEATAAMGGFPQQSYYGGPTSLRGGRGGRQKRNLHSNATFTALGIALLIGFLLPIIGPGRGGSSSTQFINLQMIGEKDVPIAVRLFFLAPLAASAAVLCVGNMMRGIPRGAIIAGTGVAAFSILFIDKEVRQVFDLFSTRSEGSGILSGMLMICGCLVMLAGILGLRRQPDYRPLAVIAIVGGAMFLLSLFIPQGADNKMPIASLFSSDTTSSARGARSRFSSTGDEPDAMIRVCAILASLGAIATAILCIVFGSTSKFTKQRAKATLGVAAGSVFLIYMSMAFAINQMLALFGDNSKGSLLVAAMIVVLKLTLWLGVQAVLFSVGLSEMMLGLAEQQLGADGAQGFSVQMTHPVQGYPQQAYAQQPYVQQPYPPQANPQQPYPSAPGFPPQPQYPQHMQQR